MKTLSNASLSRTTATRLRPDIALTSTKDGPVDGLLSDLGLNARHTQNNHRDCLHTNVGTIERAGYKSKESTFL